MTLRNTSRALLLLPIVSPLFATGCGDDDSASNTAPEAYDAGADAGEAATSSTGASVESTTATSSQALETTETSGNDCGPILAACEGKDDVDGLGNLCLRVGSGDDAAVCSILADECAAFCSTGESPTLDGGNVDQELCETMGDTCHEFDEGTGLGHLCHEVGHAGNVTWCGAIYADCVALCGEPAGPDHDHDASDASDAGATQSFTLQFAAKVGAREFACGEQYSNFGSTSSVVTPQDLRFYVSGIRLITSSGERVPVAVDELSPFQGGGVALLDFEDGTGECRTGSEITNTAIQVTAPAGQYSGVAFSTSVPVDLNHGDPLTLPAPLQAGDMTWGWLFGYKFIKAEFVQVLPTLGADTEPLDAGAPADAGDVGHTTGDAIAPMPGVGIFHLGSTACTNLLGQDAGADQFNVECAKPNFNEIVLDGFDPTTSVVTFDLGAVFAGADLSSMVMCHGEGETCPSLFASVGLDYSTGAAQTPHGAFGVE